MGTQWEVHFGWSRAMHIGLRYASLPMVMAAHKRNPHRQPLDLLMLQLQVLERAALAVLNAS